MAAKQGSLGNLRLTIRKGFNPLINYYWKMHGYVFINEENKFSELEMPSWLYIFPESLRFNAESREVIAMGRKYAAEYDLPQFKHVLIPRTKMTYSAIVSLKDRIQSIYDICIVYSCKNKTTSNVGSLWSLLLTESNEEPTEVHIHINRIPIIKIFERDDVSERDVGNWLINLFEKKDKLLNMIYLKKYDLLSNDNLVNLSLKETLPSFLFLTFSTLTLFTCKFKPFIINKIFLSGTVFSFLTIKYFSKK